MLRKKLMGLALLTAMGIAANAQFYLQGGLNLANISTSSSGQTEKNNMLTSFNAGFMSRFDLSDVFDIETGLLVSGKGSKAETYYTGSFDDNYVKTRFNPIYLEIPLNAVLKFPLQKKSKSNIFINAGLYIAMGIAGKSSYDQRILGVGTSSSSSIKFSNDDPFTSRQDDAAYDKLKRFDFGVNVGGGLDLGNFIMKLNYGMGFSKINSTQSNNAVDDKNKYRTISLSVGIPLGKK